MCVSCVSETTFVTLNMKVYASMQHNFTGWLFGYSIVTKYFINITNIFVLITNKNYYIVTCNYSAFHFACQLLFLFVKNIRLKHVFSSVQFGKLLSYKSCFQH